MALTIALDGDSRNMVKFRNVNETVRDRFRESPHSERMAPAFQSSLYFRRNAPNGNVQIQACTDGS